MEKQKPGKYVELKLTPLADGPTTPHEELVPDFCLFRPLSHNNPIWVALWPEIEV